MTVTMEKLFQPTTKAERTIQMMNSLTKRERIERLFRACPDYVRSCKYAAKGLETWVDAGLDDTTILKIFDKLPPILPLNVVFKYSLYLDVIKPSEIEIMSRILLSWQDVIVQLTPAHFSIVYHAYKKLRDIDASTEFLMQLKAISIYDLADDIELLYAENLKSC